MRTDSRAQEDRNGREEPPRSVNGRDDAELTAIALLCWLLASPDEQPESAQRGTPR